MTSPANDEGFPQARIWVEPYEQDLRFHQLGVSRPPFVDAGQQGHLQRRVWNTADDFSAAAGFNGWAGSLRAQRRLLREQHAFHNGDFLRIPVAYNEDERIAFAVSWTDDGRTGKDGLDPVTDAKGPSTVAAIEEGGQGVLDLDHGVDLWYLLLHVADEEELWAEVSWAAYTDDSDRIAGWHERIILGRIDPGAGDKAALPDASTPSAPSDITIDISRKSA
jgi:hypothetical protein